MSEQDKENLAAAETTIEQKSRYIDYLQLELRALRDKLAEKDEVIAEIERALDMNPLVDCFLTWPLPSTVCSDLCVTDTKYNTQYRVGTNLLTAVEAQQMFEHTLKRAIAAMKAYREKSR